MIITKLCGGLGNQMFQYAFGRKLAVINNCVLKLDVSEFDYDGLRSYALKYFNIVEEIAEYREIKRFHKKSFLYHTYNKFAPFCMKSYVKENPYIPFSQSYLNVKCNAYIDGYWQSEKFFSGIEELIHNEFQIKDSEKELCTEILSKITNSNSISIHIRRGDYVANPEINRIYGLCSLDYYERAFLYMIERVQKPCFFVFSDDIGWAKSNIKVNAKIYFVNHPRKEYLDLFLMSKCKHNIIANSSYSWWAAWLNHFVDKIVICPRRWFASGKYYEGHIRINSWIAL